MFGYKDVYGLLGAVGLVLLGILDFVVKKPDAVSRATVKVSPTIDTRRRLQQIYTAEVGVREATSKNDGEMVQEYLKYVGLKGNFSYCGAFICWNLGRAGIHNPRSGWAPALFPATRVVWCRDAKHGVSTEPHSGDVFCIYFQELKRIAHCGFVDAWDGTWCITVEGNTANPIRAGPSQEGVYRKKRLIKTLYKVADWVSKNH